jgi:hypothetical protein
MLHNFMCLPEVLVRGRRPCYQYARTVFAASAMAHDLCNRQRTQAVICRRDQDLRQGGTRLRRTGISNRRAASIHRRRTGRFCPSESRVTHHFLISTITASNGWALRFFSDMDTGVPQTTSPALCSAVSVLPVESLISNFWSVRKTTT